VRLRITDNNDPNSNNVNSWNSPLPHYTNCNTSKERTPTPTVAPALLFPGFPTSRRHSDTLARPMISVSLVEDDNDQEGVAMGAGRRRANSYSPLMSHNNNGGEDIVCSTGELVSLKCLSRSAVEMRALQNDFQPESGSWGPAARRGSLFYVGGIGEYSTFSSFFLSFIITFPASHEMLLS
jgi:hypothetical protein